MGRKQSEWNAFQKKHAGIGLSPQQMSAIYKRRSDGTERCGTSVDENDSTDAGSKLLVAPQRGDTTQVRVKPSPRTVTQQRMGPADSPAGKSRWNAFQQANAGKGWSIERMSTEYAKEKEAAAMCKDKLPLRHGATGSGSQDVLKVIPPAACVSIVACDTCHFFSQCRKT